MKRYNVIGYYPKLKEWCLVALGNDNLEEMKKKLEEVKRNPSKWLRNPEDVSEYKLEELTEEEDKNAWWNGNLD